MNLKEMVDFTLNSLLHQKLRSFLTVLGIIVGISSVIILVGIVQGFKEDVLEQLEDFGPRTIIITPTNPEGGGASIGPGSSFSPTTGKLWEKDFERVKKIPEIKSITQVIIGQTTMTYKDESISVSIFGIEADVFDDAVPVEIEQGRFLQENDRNVAGLGADVAEGFDEEVRTHSNVYLSEKRFKVVGVLKPTGNSFAPIDNVVFIPKDDARKLFNRSLLENEISAIYLTLVEGSDVDAIGEEIEDILLASHRVTEEEKDFGVITPTFINERFSSILDLLTIFLGAIASISLIVGGIGISNTMFMSVMERRREIGTMKAVGASQETIRNLFLVESAIIGLTGGLMGLLIAVLAGLALDSLLELTFVFDPFVIAGAIVFSILIGIISGTFPAIDAAKVDPIVALRYE
ncbi:FtsX-like permease family protein [Candidatus Micrarchaeota archaeon]|nr:FtsX-like permease family protein [Candidatus Micrarchaeota archaeon]